MKTKQVHEDWEMIKKRLAFHVVVGGEVNGSK